ncbi:MAG TPA: serine hydrolase, partial [Chitinophagales bacterium]|nr:serine hydrolase [Chitinophagales bacterium]
NDVLLARGYGFADYKKQLPLDAHTPFRLASVSKPITATAALMLVERGSLDILQPVSHYLESFPYENITVEMLLCHRSGLPNYMHFAPKYLRGKKPTTFTNDDLLEMIVKHKPGLSFRPDTRFQYSNTNYALLVNIVEKVSGEPFAQFLQTNVFDPMQMHSAYVLNAAPCPDNAACAYRSGFVKYGDDYLDGVVGDKGICGSITDLYKFHLGLERGLLLTEQTQKEAYAPRSFERDGQRNYGYGWRLKYPDSGDTVIFHNGWYHGFNNVFYRRPSDNTVIIVLSNKLNMGVYKIDKLLGILDGKEQSWDTEESEAEAMSTKPAKRPVIKNASTTYKNAAKKSKPVTKKQPAKKKTTKSS